MRLKESVFTLPKRFDNWRSEKFSNPDYVVTKVFSLVRNKTGQPVTTLIDLHPAADNNERKDFDPKARAFVRELKQLVSDRKLMRCVFASSEGAGFKIEARREPCLVLLTVQELCVDQAVRFIIKNVDKKIPDSDLRTLLDKLPRTFLILIYLALCYNEQGIKEAEVFTNTLFEEAVHLVTDSLNNGAIDLYKRVLKNGGKITPGDIYESQFDYESFHKVFVKKKNIFYESRLSTFTFQFSCISKAAEIAMKVLYSCYACRTLSSIVL